MDASEKKMRECLKCRKPFLSTHSGNRLCWTCNDENKSVWRREIAAKVLPKEVKE